MVLNGAGKNISSALLPVGNVCPSPSGGEIRPIDVIFHCSPSNVVGIIT